MKYRLISDGRVVTNAYTGESYLFQSMDAAHSYGALSGFKRFKVAKEINHEADHREDR